MTSQLEQVLQLVKVLYGGQQDQIKQANAWLDQFQKTTAAWQVADQVLSMPDAGQSAHYFAANSLHLKIRSDFRELPESSHASLRDALLAHLSRFAAQGAGANVIVGRLSFAVAALAIQMSSWDAPLRHLMALFGRDAATLRCVLAPLTVLPEEVSSHLVSVPAARRDSFSRHLEDSSPEVLQFLYMWLANSGSDSKLHVDIFKCLAGWLKACNIPLTALATNPITAAIFEALGQAHLFSVAVDCVCELVHIAGDPAPEKNPLLMFIVSRVTALADQYRQALADSDTDTARGLCRIFCEAGENYAPFVIRGTPEGFALTNVLLEAASHPEPEIAALAFSFFHAVSKCIVMSLPDERREKARPFVPYFRSFVEVTLRHMLLPTNYESQTPDQQEEFKNFRRYDLAHALRDSCTVMGVEEVLKQVMEIFAQQTAQFQSGTLTDWRGIEATLYAVRSAARCVEVEEQSAILPLLLERLPSLPKHHLLQYTAILVVGRYADWLNKNSSHLPQLLQYVAAGLSVPDVSAAAALSFQHLCNACARTLTRYTANIFDLYDACHGYHLAAEDLEEVLKGLGYVVSVLPLADVARALERLCAQTAGALHALLFTPPAAPVDQRAKDVAELLHKLGSFFRFVRPPLVEGKQSHPVVEVFGKLWAIVDAAFAGDTAAAREAVVDEAARCCRCAIGSAGEHAAPLLGPILSRVTECFRRRPDASLLYLLNAAVEAVGAKETFGAELLAAVGDVAQTALTLLSSSPNAVTDHPGLIKELFELCMQCIAKLPAAFLQSQLSPHVFNLAISVLPGSQHREAANAILAFLEHLFIASRKPPFNQNLDAALPTLGPALMHALLICIGGVQPYGRFPEMRSVLSAMRRYNLQLVVAWAASCLGQQQPPPCGPFPYAIDAQTRSELIEAINSCQREAQLLRAIEEFAYACRHSQP